MSFFHEHRLCHYSNDSQPSVTVSGTVTVDTELSAAGALADGTANPTTALMGAAQEVFNGTTFDRQRGVTNSTDSTGTGIAAAGLLAQFDDTTPSAVTENQFANLRMGSDRVLYTQGQVAHDGADSGNPVKVGAKAETSPKGITLVADGDRSNLYCDADGILMVKTNTSGADLISERVSNTDGNSTAFTNFSNVANTYNYVTAISIWNSSGTAGYVDFRDGSAGSVLYTVGCPAGGGATISSTSPLFKTAANTALAFDVSAALTTVYISISGFQSKV